MAITCAKESLASKKLDSSHRMILFDEDDAFRGAISGIFAHYSLSGLVGVYKDFKSCRRRIISSKADIVILDILLQGKARVVLLRALKREFPHIHFLILTNIELHSIVIEALNIGVAGYILKADVKTGLLQVILEVVGGGLPLSPRIARALLNYIRNT